ncbi:hypothetical protein Droror1_Dr00016447 [Drosera rotundifolia]
MQSDYDLLQVQFGFRLIIASCCWMMFDSMVLGKPEGGSKFCICCISRDFCFGSASQSDTYPPGMDLSLPAHLPFSFHQLLQNSFHFGGLNFLTIPYSTLHSHYILIMEAMYPAASLISNSGFLISALSKGRGGIWTKEENKKFESALAVYDDRTPNRWLHVTAMVPGKSVWDVIRHYEELEEDVNCIEAGLVPIPSYLGTAAFDLDWGDDDGRFDGASRKKSVGMARNHEHERKKGVPWTEDEHRMFLRGLKKHGRGDWRNISRNFVISKTPTQVASHAQKYFLRQVSTGKDRKRPSIHDITTSTLADAAGSGNESHPSPKQATTQLQRNSGVASRMLLDWSLPDGETRMMFNNATRNDFLMVKHGCERMPITSCILTRFLGRVCYLIR